jgi:hypothetical protein
VEWRLTREGWRGRVGDGLMMERAMTRRKTESGGESDFIEQDRNAGGGIETGTQVRVELPHEDAADEDKAAAAIVASVGMSGGESGRQMIKRANFSRLASKRVSSVLKRLSVLENLANTNTYDWTQQQHDKIFDTIGERLDEVIKAFADAKKPKVRDKSQLRFEV